MAKRRISADLTLQLSPMSKVSNDKQAGKCNAVKSTSSLSFTAERSKKITKPKKVMS